MRLNLEAIMVPTALLCVVMGGVAYLSYAMPQGPWYVALYPDEEKGAFAASARYADAIVDDNVNAATILVAQKKKLDALRESGAILLDPQGVPLCLRSESTQRMQP